VTYSIVGRDTETGELGVAVQSQAFNTGAAVPWAWAGIGAVATQSFTDRRYGWRGLELMAEGVPAAKVLRRLKADDELAEFRQVGMMSADGGCAQWTGANCVPAAGGAAGEGWTAQANLVESPRVWEAMGEAFAAAGGPLATRLLAALDAAQAAGGDWRGQGGAGIVVVPAEGERWERVIDLRVEESDEPLVELRRLLDRAVGYREANRAETGRAEIAQARGLPDIYVRQSALYDAVDEGRPADARRVLDDLLAEDARWLDFFRTVSRLPEQDALARLVAELDEGASQGD
jgi:uncharacterized Ntn-hydrolase superfamily protein